MGSPLASNAQTLALSEMVEVASALTEAYEHVISNTYGDSRSRILVFVADLVLRRKPYLVVSREGFLELSSYVFGNEDHRDFLFTLYYAFGSRWGMSAQRYAMLAANLAYSACPVTGGAEVNGAPSVIAQRLASATETQELIEANPWLAIVLLLQTFIRVSPLKSN
ncbi:hypothetical protein D3C71_78290 [compost metagenome]